MSTVDFDCERGELIPIEERSEGEVLTLRSGTSELPLAPEGARAKNPSFDVTPARLVTAIVTERGVASPVNEETLGKLRG
jgi:methylthioribose-1-phosphate isomerase